ncbi:MAG TPA: hypothetical protein VN765_07070, partial [Candidatus Acidoferrum sp.]|nr:hypothetical protein [Candidatus Acidoferrum sp.]
APVPNRSLASIPMPRPPGSQPNPGESNPAASPPEKTLRTFWLKEVVQQANVLLLSSDLSRVKVTRNGVESHYDLAPPPPPRAPAHQMPVAMPGPSLSYQWSVGQPGGVYMMSGNQFAQSSFSDLCLRDGDIIEIPERNPNAPAAK